MTHNIALLIVLAAPTLALIVLRVNASLVFLSLCLGAVLVQYVASEANTLIHLMSAHVSPVSTSTTQLFLLVAPAAVTTIVTIFSVHGRLKGLVNVLPAVAAGSLLLLLAVPALPPGIRYDLEGQQVWHILADAQALVIAAGATVSLFFLWTQRSFFQQRDKRRRG